MNADLETNTTAQTRVAAILVNWRQPKHTIEAARALARQTVPSLIVVVDNGSGDDSVIQIRAALPNATIIARDRNGGFGAGCNAGIECAITMGVDYVWLINNDAVPEKNCLAHLLAKADSDQAIGAVGARIREPKGAMADHAGCVMSRWTLNCRYTITESELAMNRYAWITGASMLLPLRTLEKIGLFDVGYFMYWEDADLCHRLRSTGFRLAIAEHALVEHKAGTSSNEIQLSRYQWHIESQLRWVVRNYKPVSYGLLMVYLRHLLKSVCTRNWTRFSMTTRLLKINFINIFRDILSVN